MHPTEYDSLAFAAAQAGTSGTFSPSQGLSQQEAVDRHQRDGPNELDPPQKESFLTVLLAQAKNAIFLLTMTAATLAYIFGDNVKAYCLVGIVIVVCTANAIGEYSAQDAGAALSAMVAKSSTVMRDGQWTQVPPRELVVGDVVQVKIGDTLPADLRVLSSNDLRTDEAVLTGEPLEVLKIVYDPAKEEEEEKKTPDNTGSGTSTKKEKKQFPAYMLYNATCCVGGSGTGEIVAIGMQTQVGLIAKRLQVEHVTLQLNPLQRSINLLAAVIAGMCCAIVVTATIIAYTTGYQNPMAPCPDDDDWCLFGSSLIRGTLMAVSIIPHGLPLVVMIMLKVGAIEMNKLNGLVTRRSAVDYLGATTVICTDKTGTLTEGKMTAEVIRSFCRDGAASEAQESKLEFYPLKGFSPNGGLWTAGKLTKAAKSKLDAHFDLEQDRQNYSDLAEIPDICDPDTAGKEPEGQDAVLARAHLAAAFLNCYGTKIARNEEKPGWQAEGNMSEAALKVAVCKGGLWDEKGAGTQLLQTHARDTGLEVPFSSSRKMMLTVHQLPATEKRLATMQFDSQATHIAVLKGAPDRLAPKVTSVAQLQGSLLKIPGAHMSDTERQLLSTQNRSLAQDALRTILLAVCPLSANEVAKLRAACDAHGVDEVLQQVLASPSLTFLSLWGLRDPPRAAVPGSVEECHTAGIRVVMITGDQRDTAIAIGKRVNILEEGDDPHQCASLSAALHRSPQEKLERLKLMDSESREFQRQGSRDLAIHDERGSKDSHEVEYKDQEELEELTGRVNIWSRALPTDKVAIVDSLRGTKQITAMTGDGVNDAPALKHADVGTAMGISGTMVTKNAADLILMDDNFSTIVNAVKEGRRIYNNTQKYVCFNLSIKAGECTCLMMAIVFGLPLPIRSLQALFNLVVTHIIPPMSLAFEKPESYLMKIPPRTTEGDLVVPGIMWAYKWFPFVVSFAFTVISCLQLGVWTHTGYTLGNALIGSSRVGKLEAGFSACEYGGDLDEKGQFIEDDLPFHCSCKKHKNGYFWEDTYQMDQWGIVDEGDFMSKFNRWNGDTGDVFKQANTPWKGGREALLEPCADRRGVERWCWQRKDTPQEQLPTLPQGMHCAAYGTRLGQSMAYVSIHLGEILTLLTYRTDGPFWQFLFTNEVYCGMVVFNITMLMVFLYVPAVGSLLDLAPLTAGRFLQAACFPLLLISLNETFKIIYRSRMFARNLLLAEEATDRVRPQRKALGPAKV